jgi:hypothetical protein
MNIPITVPDGARGAWRVETFTVSTEDETFQRLRAACNPQRAPRFTPAGTYKRLIYRGSVVMSNTPDECRDFSLAIHYARGQCLINGLGLGVVLQGVLSKPEVERATVIEIDQDVIDLVGAHYLARYPDRVSIICANALTLKLPSGMHYAMVWHDIWPTICADNLPDMRLLHRKYGRRADWQGSWCRAECEAANQRGW